MVYVIGIDGKPLMPTERHGKVRHLLCDGLAKVVKRTPFTIQLLYDSTRYIQDITMGIDAGSKKAGLSATTAKKELYSAVVELRDDIVKLLASRSQNRRARRNRKTRYRKPRFNNRKNSKKQGWLAPSILHKIDTHIKAIGNVCSILPVKNIVVEVASFDIQKINNPDISGKEYQEGPQLGFWNVREYVLFRDGHKCQCCKGKSKDKILNVHHIESRQTGGDAPGNLVTLCETCHTAYHKGEIKLPKSIKRTDSFKDAAFMGIMRWAFYERLKEIHKDKKVSITYGYITKKKRIDAGLPKEHYIDARVISGNPYAKPLGVYYYIKKVRRHNRQIHKVNWLKGGKKKRNQAEYKVHSYRLFDKVEYEGKEYFIFGRRVRGDFDIRDLAGNKVNKGSVSCKKLRFIEPPKGFLTEIRNIKEVPSPPMTRTEVRL